MRIAAKTDKGPVRSSNQDSYAAGEFSKNAAWAVVCDGMGGNAGGNIASSAAVKSISKKIISGYREGMSQASLKSLLLTAVANANYEIFDLSSEKPELKGMGTTVVAAVAEAGVFYVAHAGDSRAYISSETGLRQITKDHSLVQDMVEKGELTKKEAARHPSRNLITRAIGVEETLRADFTAEETESGDILIICTDGLTNYVSEEEIYRLSRSLPFEKTAEALVAEANKNGGGDNVTVVTVAY